MRILTRVHPAGGPFGHHQRQAVGSLLSTRKRINKAQGADLLAIVSTAIVMTGDEVELGRRTVAAAL